MGLTICNHESIAGKLNDLSDLLLAPAPDQKLLDQAKEHLLSALYDCLEHEHLCWKERLRLARAGIDPSEFENNDLCRKKGLKYQAYVRAWH